MRGDRPEQKAKEERLKVFTPHARGSTLLLCLLPLLLRVYPACAGIDLTLNLTQAFRASLPRMRGDRPDSSSAMILLSVFTPHARGSTFLPYTRFPKDSVYPACAGIDLGGECRRNAPLSLPRMRGDRPYFLLAFFDDFLFTPHARGSTEGKIAFRSKGGVYPACAGIDLSLRVSGKGFHGLPRMRGDRPHPEELWGEYTAFTPHARGSTLLARPGTGRQKVYPACAGIDRTRRSCGTSILRLPRMRGDRPR